MTGFQLDLDRVTRDIAEARVDDIEQATLQAYRWYHLASLGGRLSDFAAAERVTGETIARFGPREDLCLLKANLDFRFHRLNAVRQDLKDMAARPHARSLLADLDFQEGRYTKARDEYEALIKLDPVWDDMARLGHWFAKMGDPAAADLWLERAGEELTAKQLRSFAWVELQRGVLDLSRGEYAAASAHYDRADRAYPGYWLVHEHQAELLAAEERYQQSEALYLRLAQAGEPRPELLQTIGELYLMMENPSKAAPFLDQAESLYLQSAHQNEVHYWHHLSDFYSDVRPNPTEAVKWAAKDLELRQNFNTQAAMGLALSLAADHDNAVIWIDRALASNVQDAHIFAQAAKIYTAAGQPAKAREFEEKAKTLNPHPERFHVHR